MISLLSDASALKSGVDSPLYARVYTAFFNRKNEFDGVYMQKDEDENISALFSVSDRRAALILTGDADLSEIKCFFEFSGICSVTTLSETAAKFLFPNLRAYNVLKLQSAPCCGNISTQLTADANLNTYRLLYSCIATSESVGFDGFYTDFSARIAKNHADGFYIKKNDEIVSCALSPTVADVSAIISGVKTLEKYRCRGFAGDCVRSLCNSLLLRKISDIYLWCEDRRILFYENLGFEKITNIYIGR